MAPPWADLPVPRKRLVSVPFVAVASCGAWDAVRIEGIPVVFAMRLLQELRVETFLAAVDLVLMF